jgi:hypothetical protein
MRLVQTNILFRPSEIQGLHPSWVAPAVATIFIDSLDRNAFDLSEILNGSSSILDPLAAARNFLDAALRDFPINFGHELDHYTVVNTHIVNFIEEQEIAVWTNPIFGIKFGVLVKGATPPGKNCHRYYLRSSGSGRCHFGCTHKCYSDYHWRSNQRHRSYW